MAEKIKEDKMLVEREYTVPLRRKVNLSAKYRRARKAVKVLIAFVERHMKAYDTGKVLIDRKLNEEIWCRGIEKPPARIKVKCKKFESGKITVELVEIPSQISWRHAKQAKRAEIRAPTKKVEEKKEETKEEKKDEQEKQTNEKEDIKSEVESGFKQQDAQAKEAKHVVKNTQQGMKIKKNPIQRMALQK